MDDCVVPVRWIDDGKTQAMRLFKFAFLGYASDLAASSAPLSRPVAGLRTSKSGQNPSTISSRSPSNLKSKQSLNTPTLNLH